MRPKESEARIAPGLAPFRRERRELLVLSRRRLSAGVSVLLFLGVMLIGVLSSSAALALLAFRVFVGERFVGGGALRVPWIERFLDYAGRGPL